jgi:hypothetical protein
MPGNLPSFDKVDPKLLQRLHAMFAAYVARQGARKVMADGPELGSRWLIEM